MACFLLCPFPVIVLSGGPWQASLVPTLFLVFAVWVEVTRALQFFWLCGSIVQSICGLYLAPTLEWWTPISGLAGSNLLLELICLFLGLTFVVASIVMTC